jgi:uncharacterized protein (TIGR02246 family)
MNEAEKASIQKLLMDYEKALNTSDTNAVMQLYTSDGAFMPQHSPSSIGTDAIRSAYNDVFEAIQLSVKFNIAEIQVIAPEWAFARTNSAGTVKIHANGAGGPEANQELFIFNKSGGVWKIARYCFTTNPPRNS